nr:immunoglobulin light chain junction region [Macaca mulatta]
CQQHNNHPPTF